MIEKNSKEHKLLQAIRSYPRHNIIRYKEETGLDGLQHTFKRLMNEGLIIKHQTPGRRVFYTDSLKGRLLLDIWHTEEQIDDCFADITSIDYAIYLNSMENLKKHRNDLQNGLEAKKRLLSLMLNRFEEMK